MTGQTCTVPRAALKRLAQDAGTYRVTAEALQTDGTFLERFLTDLVKDSYRACTFSRKRTIAPEHILWAARARGLHLPEELANEGDELRKLQKCNFHAPAGQRKASALHAEMSEAFFSRICKRAANECTRSCTSPHPAAFAATACRKRVVASFRWGGRGWPPRLRGFVHGSGAGSSRSVLRRRGAYVAECALESLPKRTQANGNGPEYCGRSFNRGGQRKLCNARGESQGACEDL